MSLKQNGVLKTGFQSKSRILLIGLIFSAVVFVFAVQVEWVPYLNYSSSSSMGDKRKGGSSSHILEGSSHISIQDPPPSQQPPASSVSPSVSQASESTPSPAPVDITSDTLDSIDDNGVTKDQLKDSSGSNVSDDNDDDGDPVNKHEYDEPSPSLPPPATTTLASTLTASPTTPPKELSNQDENKDGNKEHNPFLTMFPPRPPKEGERFLGYIPHSGFHNQLQTLETAIRLAAYLNRTLLLPPLHLSRKKQALVWKEPSIMLQQWADRNRTGVEYCRDVDTSNWPRVTRKQLEAMPEQERKRDRECRFYHSWTTVPWTYFYDIPKVLESVVGTGGQTEPVRVLDRPVMSLEWLHEHLQIRDPSKEIYYFNETARYQYRIVDDSEVDYSLKPGSEEDLKQQQVAQAVRPPEFYSTMAIDLPTEPVLEWSRRYQSDLRLTDLQKRPERVLHFGSLYASDRVEARSQDHLALKSMISQSMDLWNEGILEASAVAEVQIKAWIKETKRAAPGFFGVHLRTEDSLFEKLAPRNLQRIVVWLGEMVKLDRKYFDKNTTTAKNNNTNTNNTQALDKRAEPVQATTTDVPTFLERCMAAPPESPMVFMATDVHQPRHSVLLHDYLDQFPCTMFLSDFVPSLSILEKIKNPLDGILMSPYMVALMDANLAAKGREFQGTDRSTFSGYIIDHLFPEYHPDHAPAATY
ncbi:hypothetical protein BGZ68_002955 [Mortierella alpina]|nr:hypothetical protein BGZ68_002955 [Mortierella alpina]